MVKSEEPESVVEGAVENPETTVVEIEDEQIPLAEMPFEEEGASKNWLWAVVVAVLGGAGFETLRRNKKKSVSEVTKKNDKQ